MRHLVWIAALASLAGCARSTCQDACSKVFAPEQCDIQAPTVSWETLYDDCVSDCIAAMYTPGELDGYDPQVRDVTGEMEPLENRAQAEAWAECITETSCEDLYDGYCPPI